MKRSPAAFIALLLGIACLGGSLGHAAANPAKGDGTERQRRGAPPAPAVRLTAEPAWDEIYAGDPLAITVRLSSPRARQEAELRSERAEQGEKVEAGGFAPPPIASRTLATGVAFKLFRLRRDGSREQVLAKEDWRTFLVRREGRSGAGEGSLGLRPLREEWMVPPDLMAPLGVGRYSLEVAWLGKGIVDASHLGAEGKLAAEPVVFEIKVPANNQARAAHEERLAYFEYSRARYREALNHGRAALALDPDTFTPEKVDTYLLVANAAIGLGDHASAAAAYRDLLKRLPPPSSSDLALAIMERLKLLDELKR